MTEQKPYVEISYAFPNSSLEDFFSSVQCRAILGQDLKHRYSPELDCECNYNYGEISISLKEKTPGSKLEQAILECATRLGLPQIGDFGGSNLRLNIMFPDSLGPSYIAELESLKQRVETALKPIGFKVSTKPRMSGLMNIYDIEKT
jgi:hypothetical protein